jgi:phage shock protein C
METAVRRLTRSRTNRVFAGVCGGLAGYLGWDPVVIRIAYVILTLLSFGSAGVLLYLIAWLVIPLEPESPVGIAAAERTPRSRARITVGVLLVIAGALALLDSFMPWFLHMFTVHVTASIILIVAGLALILWQREESPEQAAVPSPAPAASPRETSARQLVRIHQGRKIAGVCVGLGRYFAMDPTIVRLLFLVLFFAGGSGLLLYLILWIVMPLEDA